MTREDAMFGLTIAHSSFKASCIVNRPMNQECEQVRFYKSHISKPLGIKVCIMWCSLSCPIVISHQAHTVAHWVSNSPPFFPLPSLSPTQLFSEPPQARPARAAITELPAGKQGGKQAGLAHYTNYPIDVGRRRASCARPAPALASGAGRQHKCPSAVMLGGVWLTWVNS